MTEVTRDAAADRIARFAAEGRLVQGKWHGSDAAGREIACLLGAIHPDVRSPQDCPASIMPAWLASLLPVLFDGIPAARASEYGARFAHALRIGRMSDSARDRWLAAVVTDALESARPEGSPPGYWAAVETACDGVVRVLRTGKGRSETAAAARAAEAAAARAAEAAVARAAEAAAARAAEAAVARAAEARAAEAVEWAAEAATAAAAEAAVARAAARAAKAAAWAAWAAARAARAAAQTEAGAAGAAWAAAWAATAAVEWAAEAAARAACCERMFDALLMEMES